MVVQPSPSRLPLPHTCILISITRSTDQAAVRLRSLAPCVSPPVACATPCLCTSPAPEAAPECFLAPGEAQCGSPRLPGRPCGPWWGRSRTAPCRRRWALQHCQHLAPCRGAGRRRRERSPGQVIWGCRACRRLVDAPRRSLHPAPCTLASPALAERRLQIYLSFLHAVQEVDGPGRCPTLALKGAGRGAACGAPAPAHPPLSKSLQLPT